MSGTEDPTGEHQVGITNAQENNPDRTIADLTAEMNARFQAGGYLDAARIAFSITGLGKDELRQTFEKHGVTILHLDHEAFGIYEVIEPSYDLRVDGATTDVLAAATEFGKRHAPSPVHSRTLPRTDANTMNAKKSVREIAEEMNAEAKRKGMHLDRDPWSIPADPNFDIFDRLTPEEEALTAQLRGERLARAKAAKHATEQMRESQGDVTKDGDEPSKATETASR